MGETNSKVLTIDEIMKYSPIIKHCLDIGEHPSMHLPNCGVRRTISFEAAIKLLMNGELEKLSECADMVVVAIANDVEYLKKVGFIEDLDVSTFHDSCGLGNIAYVKLYGHESMRDLCDRKINEFIASNNLV